jgi:hypothetical protein
MTRAVTELSGVRACPISKIRQDLTDIAESASLHAVVLDSPGLGVQELIGEIGVSRCLDIASSGYPVGEHLRRGHRRCREMHVEEAAMPVVVIYRGNPLADNSFQLVDVEEGVAYPGS